jgi:Cu-processing system permease protein
MEPNAVYHIALQELTINIRNKWTIIFAVVFGALVVSISCFGMLAEGFSGMQSFTRTSASLLNLVLYVVPLVSLTMGTLSFTGDKGSTELLFSQPLSRTEVLLGKMLGLFFSVSLSTLIGFALAGTVVIATNGIEGLSRYVSLVALALLLSLVFLGLSMLVSIASKRKPKAFGMALFLWFFFVLLYDVLALGGTLLLKGQTANHFLFLSVFGNPVDMVRVGALIILDNVTIFGAAGAALLRYLGGQLASVALLVAGLLVWVSTPIFLSIRMMRKQDV